MESLSQKRLNPWLTAEQLDEINLYYTTMFTDENGQVLEPRYGSVTVRNDITKLVAEVKRLQAIENRYKSALTDILESYYIPTAVQEIAKNTLEGVNDHE